MGHPPRVPVRLPWEQRVIYFVTICVDKRQWVLANDPAFNAFRTAVERLKHWRVLAAMLMPDHMHIFVTPTQDRYAKLGNFSAAVKRWMGEELSGSWNFQPSCFDRLRRSDESLHDKWLYVRENPVRAGLVKDWLDWPYQIGLDNA